MIDFVVVKLSKTKAAREILEDSGVDENARKEDRRCDRMVVLPEPDSPLRPCEYKDIQDELGSDLQEDHCLIFSPAP